MNRTETTVAALLVAVLAGIGIFAARSYLTRPPEAGLSSSPLPTDGVPPSLPPLEESDALVRRRAGALSADASFTEWLALESLIPRLATAMSRISQGGVPRDIFSAFGPRGKFAVVKKDGKVFVDAAAFARYDGFAAMVASIDAVAAAKVFEDLLPLFDAAQRGLGDKNPSAREAFFAAARELLGAPVLADAAALKQAKKGIGWTYADERLESLSPAQKQLLRMGPKNQAAVQAKIRAVALALGVPGSQLQAVSP
jgi:hypothetical protein